MQVSSIGAVLLVAAMSWCGCGRSPDTALHRAVKAGDTAAVKRLIADGAAPSAQDESGNTPLHLAVRANRSELVQILLDSGASVRAANRAGMTPLHWTFRRDIALLLLERGADVNARNKNNDTPLHLLAIPRHGAAATPCGRMWRQSTPARRERIELIKFLVTRGADMAARDRGGRTPLHVAANWGSLECVRVLAEVGADLRARDNLGMTPLDYATAGGYGDVAELLRQRMSVRARGKAMTPESRQTKPRTHSKSPSDMAGRQQELGAWRD